MTLTTLPFDPDFGASLQIMGDRLDTRWDHRQHSAIVRITARHP